MTRLLTVVVGAWLCGCGAAGSNAHARSASDADSVEAELTSLRAELDAKETELRTTRGQLALARAEAQELRAGSGRASEPPPPTRTPSNAKPPWLAKPVTVATPAGDREVLSVFEGERLDTTGDIPDLPAFIEEDTLAAPAAKASAVEDTGVEAYRRGLDLIREQRFDEARQAFSAFLDVHPNHTYADNALFWRGELHFLRGEYGPALADFLTIERHHPWGNKLPDALFRIGQIYRKRGDETRARAYFDKVREQFPDTAAARLALREDAS